MKYKKDKSPAKFIGTAGLIKGVLGGAGDVIANRRAAKAAGQDYSFGQGFGDFVQGGISGIIGVGPTVNRAGTPSRSINDLQPINTIQDPGMQSAQQAAAYSQFNNIAQTMPPSPVNKTEKEVVYQTKSVGDKPTERRNNAQELEGKKPGGKEQPKNTTYMSMLPEIEIKG